MLGLILAGASLAVGIGKDIAAKKAAEKQAAAIAKAAIASRNEGFRQLSLQESQQEDATAQTISQIDAQSKRADALGRVSAGEAGVAGASVEALISDIGAQASAAKLIANRNLKMTVAQIQEQKRGLAADAQNRINQAKAGVPSGAAVGLDVLSQGLGFASTYIGSRPVGSKTSSTVDPNSVPLYIPVGH